MKRTLFLFLTLTIVLTMVGCRNAPTVESIGMEDDFSIAVPVDVKDSIKQNCIDYANRLGYEAGNFKKSVLLGEAWTDAVLCDDSAMEEMIDRKDIVVIFDGIRCVVDVDTEAIIGRIPLV